MLYLSVQLTKIYKINLTGARYLGCKITMKDLMIGQLSGLICAVFSFLVLELKIEPRFNFRKKIMSKFNIYKFCVFSTFILIFVIMLINILTDIKKLAFIHLIN